MLSDEASAVIRAFIIPKVESIRIVFVPDEDGSPLAEYFSWEKTFPPDRDYSCLRDLALHVDDDDESALVASKLLPGLLQNFPQAQTLVL